MDWKQRLFLALLEMRWGSAVHQYNWVIQPNKQKSEGKNVNPI